MEKYDVVVIGAGVHGAGVAQAAAAHGHSVLILEQNTPASATSSRSSKLIHGGLRYLESAQLGLVRECLHERELLLRLAPELVKLSPFYIPVYVTTHRKAWQIRAGLTLYSLLGGLGPHMRFKSIPRHDWDALDGLDDTDLRAVYRYYDGQTDDVALTHAVIHSAQMHGAHLSMPSRFTHAELRESACVVHYEHHGQTREVETKTLVNTAGPWVNKVLDLVTPKPAQLPMDLVQGSHIIVDGRLGKGVYYMEAPRDQRAVFAIPWKDQIMVGTTETVFDDEPDKAAPLKSEIAYLLEVLKHYFPQYRLGAEVVDAFAGLRVLPASEGSAFGRSRDSIIETDRSHKPRLLTIYTGKLTAYRATAEKVMHRLHASLPNRTAVADTRKLMLVPVSLETLERQVSP